MYSVLPRGLALGALLALLLSLFDGGTAIPSPGPSFNNGCAVYDKFGVLHHDCRLARLESSFAPTVMRLQRSLLAATDSQGRHTESRPFGNFSVTLSLARHQLPASSNALVHTLQKFAVVHAYDAEPQGEEVCIPHVQSHAQDAFRNPDGQLRSEVCKERLICCDEAPDGVSKFMSDRPASCSATCLLRMTIKNNRRGGEQADCQSESRPRPRMPLEEGFDSAAVWDEPTGASCLSHGEDLDSGHGDQFCSDSDGQSLDDCNDIPAKGIIDPFPSVTEPSFLDVVGRFSRKMGSKMAVESNYQDKHGHLTHAHGHGRHGHHPSRTNSEDSSTQNGEDDDGDTSADDDIAVNDGAPEDDDSPPQDSPPEAEDPVVEDPAEAPAPMTSASPPPSTSDSSPKNVQSGPGSGSGSGAAAAAAAAGGAAAASSSGSGAGAAAATSSS